MDKPKRKPQKKTVRHQKRKSLIPKQQRPSLDKYHRKSRELVPHVKRLLRAMATVNQPTSLQILPCDECEARLVFFVDAERRSEPVEERFPEVWEHLRSCHSCQESYRLLKVGLDADATASAGIALSSRPSLPFLASRSADGVWTKRSGSRLLGEPISFEYYFQAAYVQLQLSRSRPATFGLRGEILEPAKKAVILMDSISLGDRNVLVEIWAERLPDPAMMRIEIQLTSSSTPLPEHLHVHLAWNGFEHTGLMQGDQYVFDEFPVFAMQGEGVLHIEFQAEDNSAIEVEGQSGGSTG